MEMIKQESARDDSATIDIVLVIFGLNDLKKVGLDGAVSQFRQGMEQPISDIRCHAPGALVVILKSLSAWTSFLWEYSGILLLHFGNASRGWWPIARATIQSTWSLKRRRFWTSTVAVEAVIG